MAEHAVSSRPAAPERGERRAVLQRVAGHPAFWIALIDVALILIFGLLSPNNVFWTLGSFQNLAVDSAEALLLTTGVALLLGAGEFDISQGANVVLSSVIGGKVMLALGSAGTLPAILLGALTCVACGAGMGAVNGIVVTKLGVNSLVATLGTLGIATGAADLITNGSDLAGFPLQLQSAFGSRVVLGVPLPALVALALFGVAWLVLRFTRSGVRILALGSSRESAVRSGLRVDRLLIVLFLLTGALVGVAGFIDISRFGTTNVSGHQTDALASIGAAVIGGASLWGGRVPLLGALFGALLAVILQDGLVVVGLSPFFQLIATGVVLIAAVHLDQQRRQRSGRPGRVRARLRS
ncbi:MAG: hypothetical protein JWQ48_3987 [Conexibacter sp.]|nr:hypothetical protein [Conexibacter sp.]